MTIEYCLIVTIFVLHFIVYFYAKFQIKMSRKEDFFKVISEGNTTKGDFITLGSAILDGETLNNAFVNVPLKTMNRHGLIAGATGTGKTKTLQVLAENLK